MPRASETASNIYNCWNAFVHCFGNKVIIFKGCQKYSFQNVIKKEFMKVEMRTHMLILSSQPKTFAFYFNAHMNSRRIVSLCSILFHTMLSFSRDNLIDPEKRVIDLGSAVRNTNRYQIASNSCKVWLTSVFIATLVLVDFSIQKIFR